MAETRDQTYEQTRWLWALRAFNPRPHYRTAAKSIPDERRTVEASHAARRRADEIVTETSGFDRWLAALVESHERNNLVAALKKAEDHSAPGLEDLDSEDMLKIAVPGEWTSSWPEIDDDLPGTSIEALHALLEVAHSLSDEDKYDEDTYR